LIFVIILTANSCSAKECCQLRLESAARALLLDFVSKNTDAYSALLCSSLLGRVRSKFPPREYLVIPEVVDIGVKLDSLMVASCIVLGDVPPALKVTAPEREFGRRSTGKRTSTAQLDIERLFSQRIEVLQVENLVASAVSSLPTVVTGVVQGFASGYYVYQTG
jgi:hypothetical protein